MLASNLCGNIVCKLEYLCLSKGCQNAVNSPSDFHSVRCSANDNCTVFIWSFTKLAQPRFTENEYRLTPGDENALLTIQAMGDRDGKACAAQLIHAMNVMAGFAECLRLLVPRAKQHLPYQIDGKPRKISASEGLRPGIPQKHSLVHKYLIWRPRFSPRMKTDLPLSRTLTFQSFLEPKHGRNF